MVGHHRPWPPSAAGGVVPVKSCHASAHPSSSPSRWGIWGAPEPEGSGPVPGQSVRPCALLRQWGERGISLSKAEGVQHFGGVGGLASVP